MYERVPTFVAGHELAEEAFGASTSNVHSEDSSGSRVWDNVLPRTLSNNSVGRNVDRPSTGNGYPVANLTCLMGSTGLEERSRVNTTWVTCFVKRLAFLVMVCFNVVCAVDFRICAKKKNISRSLQFIAEKFADLKVCFIQPL